MWKLDENDPLDRALLKELRGEAIDFLEWENLLEELEEEPDAETRLQEHGYTVERGLREGEAYRAEFLSLLEKYDLPVDDRFRLVYHFAELAIDGVPDEQTDELLRIYCGLLFGPEFLLDQNREAYQGADGALAYLDASLSCTELYDELKQRIATAERFREFLSGVQKNSPPKTDCDTSMMHAVFQESRAALGAYGDDAILLGNIEYLLQISAGSAGLRAVEPLFLYQAIMRNHKRLCTTDTLRMDLKALWKYKKYQIDRDNGKNYDMNKVRLEFFAGLCGLYKNDPSVDLPLCWYGFEKLSNLGDFYRAEIEPENFPDPPTLELNLPEPLEERIGWNRFSCFEAGGRNVILEGDSSLTPGKLERFHCDPKYRRPLDRLAAYMNKQISQLAARFWDADDEAVKTLCNEVLNQAALPTRWQPKTLQEISLYLATINGGLMEQIDLIADNFLLQAGRALLREAL